VSGPTEPTPTGPPASPPTPPVSPPQGEPDATEKVDRAADAAEERIADVGASAQERIHDASEKLQDQVRRTEEQVKAKVRDTEAKVRTQVEQVQSSVGDLKGLSDPTPAGSVDEAVTQAADLRRAIDADLDVLQAKLPPGEELAQKARAVGGAVLGVAAVAAAVLISQKQRKERKRIDREAKAHAAAIARYLPGAASRPIEDDEGGGKGKFVLLALVGAAVAAIVASRSQTDDGEPDIWGPPR
jgi:gas vesicle protein